MLSIPLPQCLKRMRTQPSPGAWSPLAHLGAKGLEINVHDMCASSAWILNVKCATEPVQHLLPCLIGRAMSSPSGQR